MDHLFVFFYILFVYFAFPHLKGISDINLINSEYLHTSLKKWKEERKRDFTDRQL